MLCRKGVFFVFGFLFLGGYFLFLNQRNVLAQFAGGVGTSESPYQISDCIQLQNIGSTDVGGSAPYIDDYFVLTSDIDCSESRGWNEDSSNPGVYFGFDPIYYYDEINGIEYIFSGSLDGKGFTINNLYINRPTEYEVGLFGYTFGSFIVNLNLTNVDITGGNYVGGVASAIENVVISNISVGGSLTAVNIDEASYVGGVVAGAYFDSSFSLPDFIIDDCHFSGVITTSGGGGGIFGTIRSDIGDTDVMSINIDNSSSFGIITAAGAISQYIGGLVGENRIVGISNSFSSMDINGGYMSIGGLVGFNNFGFINNTYSTGDIDTTGSIVGGLVGDNRTGRIEKSYSTSQVSAGDVVGGLVGASEGHIENTYATGDVSGNNYVGGLIGRNAYSSDAMISTIINSYSTGSVTGSEYVGGLIGYNFRDEIINSYAVGEVIGVGTTQNYIGGFVGAVLYDGSVIGESADTFLINNGWYKSIGSSLSAIGEVIDDDSNTLYGPRGIVYEETDPTVFYSKSHAIYSLGETFSWDFTTPVWYEWTDNYPLSTQQILITPTPDLTLTPTPTPTPTPTQAPSVIVQSINNPPGAPVCTDNSPLSSPDLFRIESKSKEATLYYSPTNFKTTAYAILYGFAEGDERFGVIAPIVNNNEGVQSFTIRDLEPGKTYYFKISAINGCSGGPWSKWLSSRVSGSVIGMSRAGELPKTGTTIPTVMISLMGLISLSTSVFLFKK